MKRSALGIGLVVVGFGAAGWLAAQPPKADSAKPADKSVERQATALCNKLNQPISIDKPIDNAPLRDVLDYLSDKYDLTFVIDARAFEQDKGMRNVEDQTVRLPKMPGVRFRQVLRHLLNQINGAVLVRGDHLEVTTLERLAVEMYGAGPYPAPGGNPQHLPPAVCAVFDRKPLERALAELADQSGKNIVLDPRVPEKDTLLVTAQLLNTPVDTATRVVAELAGQKMVALDNVFYVTTKEHADNLAVERENWKSERRQIESTPVPNRAAGAAQ